MSNVHRVGDYDNNNNPSQANNRQYQQGVPAGRNQTYFFLGPNDDDVDGGGGGGDVPAPYPPVSKMLAPNFSRNTFIFWMTITQICVFIAELIVGQLVEGAAFVSSNDMGGPSSTTLKIMGAKYLKCIQNGEVYRFITPAFLHSGVLHIFTNLVSQTMIGYTCEMSWGFWRTVGYYFSTTFGASLLSCVGTPCGVSVGASGALLGIIGAYMAWLLLNWSEQQQPLQRMCIMIMWLFVIFLIGISDTGIDSWAHFGGWLSGVFIGFTFNEATDPVTWIQANIWKIVNAILAMLYFCLMLFACFFWISTSSCSSCW